MPDQPVSAKTVPTYAAAFRCIGASCEDPCCGDWNIPLDKATYDYYQQFPLNKLGSVVQNFVFLEDTAAAAQGTYAQIHRTPSGPCPFFDSDRLCSIQREYGPRLLSATCSIYPRSLSRVNGELEGSLSLSCPEAARNILLVPDFMQVEGDLNSGDFRTDNFFQLRNSSTHKPHAFFHALRTLLIEVVRDRSRPIWQRLLLIGLLCKRLEETTATAGDEAVPALLADFRQFLESKDLHTEFKNMPGSLRIKLEVVLGLTNERVQDTRGNRFRDTFWNFVEGIGSPIGSMPGDDIERFQHAEENYHRPFLERSPFILENYLLNYIVQNLFPFGREGSAQFIPRSMFEEWILMTTQFAWINALLIGISGHYKESFAEEHVVSTIQSFTRAVEHYPAVLNSIIEYMKLRKLNTFQGMAIMLKN
jgi:lysine-N-methylase